MNGRSIGLIALGIVFGVNTILLLWLVSLKAFHRHRTDRRAARRAAYLAAISRHLADPHHAVPITAGSRDDDALLDAIIDLRNIVSGSEIETLAGIVGRVGILDRQVARLRSRFPLGKRLRAAVALAEMGDETTAPVLIEHLGDPEPEVRIQSARGLGRMHHTAAIDSILDRLSQEEPWVRARFADTLAGFGTKATWPLVAYIRVNLGHDGNVGVVEAIRVLGVIGDREVGPTLSGLLGITDDPEVKLAAIEALGLVGGPLAIRPLRYSFRSPDWRIRAKSATSLGRIGDPSINGVLSTGLEDENWWVRRNSAAALASLHGGVNTLMEALQSQDRFARDAAAEALADCGALAAARDRIDAGDATMRDRSLIALVDDQVAVNA